MSAVLTPDLTAVPAEATRDVRLDWGACTYSGCLCQAFSGSGDLCGNCGHNYDEHGPVYAVNRMCTTSPSRTT